VYIQTAFDRNFADCAVLFCTEKDSIAFKCIITRGLFVGVPVQKQARISMKTEPLDSEVKSI
jgi:hypothetical protein